MGGVWGPFLLMQEPCLGVPTSRSWALGCSKPGEGVSEVSSNSLGSGAGGHGEGGDCCHLRGQNLRVALLG